MYAVDRFALAIDECRADYELVRRCYASGDK